MNIDNIEMKPPLELAPGWDTSEIPITELLLPYDSDEVWKKNLADIYSWNLPPIAAASHWLKDERITGDKVTDFNELERQAGQTCKRMTEVGCPIAGVWGNFFEVPDGFSRNKATDQALTYCNMVSTYADKYGILIAIEPTGNPNTVFPKYTDGIDFIKRLNKKSIRLMADLNYFVAISEPFEDILLEPELCLHVHIQGEIYQPNVGYCTNKILRIFSILREMNYDLTVSSAHPWTSTEGNTFNYRIESEKTLKFLQTLREKVYTEQ